MEYIKDGRLVLHDDEFFMREALKCAMKAFDAGEVPVGAVAVKEGVIIAKAYNQVELLKDATAHAELMLISSASNIIGDWRMDGVTLYVTKEPCAMCAGAMVNSRVTRVVYGMCDPRSGAAGGAVDITGFKGMLHNVQTTKSILEDECKTLMQTFFRERRNEAKDTAKN